MMRARFSLFLLACLGLFLGSCGYNSSNGTGSATDVTPPATGATRITPSRNGASPTPSPPVTPSSGGPVAVQISASTYHPSDTITVTVANPSTQSIFFADHQTNCTTVLLQRQTETSWEPVALCQLQTVTRLLELHSGRSLTVSLKPSPLWLSGNYRVVFRYGHKIGNGLGPSLTLYSSVFQIR